VESKGLLNKDNVHGVIRDRLLWRLTVWDNLSVLHSLGKRNGRCSERKKGSCGGMSWSKVVGSEIDFKRYEKVKSGVCWSIGGTCWPVHNEASNAWFFLLTFIVEGDCLAAETIGKLEEVVLVPAIMCG